MSEANGFDQRMWNSVVNAIDIHRDEICGRGFPVRTSGPGF